MLTPHRCEAAVLRRTLQASKSAAAHRRPINRRPMAMAAPGPPLDSPSRPRATLDSLNFDNKALRALPLDREVHQNYVRSVAGIS